MSVQERRLAIIQRVTDEWQDEVAGRVKPQRRYQHAGPSQYAEGMLVLSAPTADQDDLQARIAAALNAAGLPQQP